MDFTRNLIEAAQAKGISAELTYQAKAPVPVAELTLDGCAFQVPGDLDHGRPTITLIEGRSPLYLCPHPRCNNRSIFALAEKLGVTLPTTQDTYQCITMTELLAGDYPIVYLIHDALVEGEVCFFGGGYKSLKTSCMMDQAISLTTGSPFLGSLAVLQKRRVLFMSGESGKPVLQDIAKRIFASKNVAANDDLILSEDLPRLDDPDALAKLQRTITAHRAQVLMVDPLYLCFGSENHGNLMEQGKMLSTIRRACREANVTPVLAHHTTKAAAKKHDPPQLADLTQSGFAEFAAQWLLLGRRETYRPGEPHRLWLSVGGRAGHTDLHLVDIDEGLRPRRKWDITIGNGYASLESDRLTKWCDSVLAALKKAKKPLPTSHAVKAIKSTADQRAVLNHLLEQGKIRVSSEVVKRGKTITYYELAA